MAKKPTYSVRFVAGQPVERIEPSPPLSERKDTLPIGMPLHRRHAKNCSLEYL